MKLSWGDLTSSTGHWLLVAFKVTSSLKLKSFLICHMKRLQLIIMVVPSELAILLFEIKINISLPVFFDSAKIEKHLQHYSEGSRVLSSQESLQGCFSSLCYYLGKSTPRERK